MIDAIGAPITAFARLKLADGVSWKADNPSQRSNARGHAGGKASILRALAAVGIPPDRTSLVEDEGAPMPDCPGYSSHRFVDNSSFRHGRPSYLRSMAGQLESRHAGVAMVVAHETRFGVRFDWVLYTRPDLLWYRPLRPWCYLSRNATLPPAAALRTQDFAFLLPRAMADAALAAPHRAYHACRADLPHGKLFEHWQRGLWRANGVWPNPFEGNAWTLPTVVIREQPWLYGRREFSCTGYLRIAERREAEPDLMNDWRLCTKITNGNRCAREGPLV